MLVMMMENTIAVRLKRLLVDKGITQYRLSKDTGISESYISQLIKGEIPNPRQDTLLKIAKGMNINVAELMGEQRNPSDTWSLVETSLKAYIPVYAEVSAGEGIEPIDYVATTRNKAAPESLRAYRVKGLCLEPDVPDNSTLIVDTAQTPNVGDLVVVIIEGKASVKRFMGDHLENHYGNYRPEDVHMVGVVIEVTRRLK